MALFRRKKDQDILPDEVKDYYKAEQRDRVGMAWVVAVGGFLVTVAIVVGLFFAGRWVYQTYIVNDTDTTSEVEETDATDEDELPPATVLPEDENDEDEAEDDDVANDEAPTDQAAEENDELPRTGPLSE
jgi:hypothetical protein